MTEEIKRAVQEFLGKQTRTIARETIEAPEAAEILGCSTWKIYEMAKRKEIPHVKCGRRVLFRRSSILRWLDEQEASSVRQGFGEQYGRIRKIQ